MTELRDLFAAWREAVAQRSSRGELRATREESETLQKFSDALEQASNVERSAWERERSTLGDAQRCDCGHPAAHHDASGSCFHIVGCATACGCTR